MRKQAWIKHGCNAFDGAKQTSQPMSFWIEQDELETISKSIIVNTDIGPYGVEVLVNDRHAAQKLYPDMVIEPAQLEQITIHYVSRKG